MAAKDGSANVQRGKFITFEGIEGSGKTTQAALLADYLRTQGKEVLLLSEPAPGFPGGTELHKLLYSKEWLPKSELLLTAAARIELWEKTIKPALEQGTWVICERFSDCTMIYHLAYHEHNETTGVSQNHIELMGKYLLGNAKPDLTVLLDLNLTTRASSPNWEDRTDKFGKLGLKFILCVQEKFREYAKEHPKRIKIVDNDGWKATVVHERVLLVVQRKFF